jgi:cytochrome c oxidase subunit 2
MPQILIHLLGLPPEGSTSSVGIDWLHLFVISVTILSAIGVFAVVVFFFARYSRKSDTDLTPRVVANTTHELMLAGSILALFLLWWVIGFRQYIALREPPADATTVYVSAKQWMWKFSYTDGRVANDVLTVPVGKPIKLVMGSRDVIHSLYIPAFRIKQDVIPGRYTTMWFEAKQPGAYPIMCAEYCGLSHSKMSGVVVALSPTDYATWLRKPVRDASGEADMIAEGAKIAAKRECLACHTIDGQPHIGPTWAGLYGSMRETTDHRTIKADEAYLTRSMIEPNADVVLGYKPVMPVYFGLLDPAETASLVEYIKSLRDHAQTTPGTIPEPSGIRLPKTSTP